MTVTLVLKSKIGGEIMEGQETNELLKIKRQKLFDLQQEGKDPFKIVKYDQTNHSKEIVEKSKAPLTFSIMTIRLGFLTKRMPQAISQATF